MKPIYAFKTCDTCGMEKTKKTFYKESNTCNKCAKEIHQKKMDTGLYYNPEETKKIWYYNN